MEGLYDALSAVADKPGRLAAGKPVSEEFKEGEYWKLPQDSTTEITELSLDSDSQFSFRPAGKRVFGARLGMLPETSTVPKFASEETMQV